MAYLLKELLVVVAPRFALNIHRWLDSADSYEDSQNNDGSLGTILQQVKDAVGGLFAESAPVVTESYISTLFRSKESAPVVTESYISTLFRSRATTSPETDTSWWDPTAALKAGVTRSALDILPRHKAAEVFHSNLILPALASLGFAIVLVTIWWQCKQRRCPESRSNELLPDIKKEDNLPRLDYSTRSKERKPGIDYDSQKRDKTNTRKDSCGDFQQESSRDLDVVSFANASHETGYVSAKSEETTFPDKFHYTAKAPSVSFQVSSKRSATSSNGPSRAPKSDTVSAASHSVPLAPSNTADAKYSALTPFATEADFPELTVNTSRALTIDSGSASSSDICEKVPPSLAYSLKMVVTTPTSVLKVSRENSSISSLSLSGSIIVAEDTLAPFALAPSYNVGQLIPGHAQNLEILAILGRGNQAALYKVSDGISSFAAKITHSDELLKDLILEFDILIALKHPNVIAVHDRLPRGFLMDCLSQDLQSFIESSGHVIPKVRDRLSQGILEGVDFIHDSGIAHLDIKPENILLTVCGVPKLCDFGLAVKYRNDDGTMLDLESYHGTPHYVSPEMFKKAIFVSDDVIDLPKSDCWSAGVTLFQILSGQVLFAGNTEIEVFQNQRCNNYNYPPFLSGLTPVDTDYYYFMEMVKGLCKNNPVNRLSARKALCHKCFKDLEEISV